VPFSGNRPEPIVAQKPSTAPLRFVGRERCLAKEPDKRYVSPENSHGNVQPYADRSRKSHLWHVETRPTNLPCVCGPWFVGAREGWPPPKNLLLRQGCALGVLSRVQAESGNASRGGNGGGLIDSVSGGNTILSASPAKAIRALISSVSVNAGDPGGPEVSRRSKYSKIIYRIMRAPMLFLLTPFLALIQCCASRAELLAVGPQS